MPAETSLAALIDARASLAQKKVLTAAQEVAAERETPLYLVGGAIRDLLATGELRDFDLVVEGDGIGLARELAQRIDGRFRSHDRFLTAEVANEDIRADIVTARVERYDEPAALPSVTAASMEEDLARRDFSVNSMAYRLWPAAPLLLLDPFSGKVDLDDGWLRVLHRDSFIDDPTRILRGVRLGSRLGLTMEPGTLELAEEAIALGAFEPLSPDRLRSELILVLSEREAEKSLRLLEEIGFLRFLGFSAPFASHQWSAVGQLIDQRESAVESEAPIRWWLAILMAVTFDAPHAERLELARRLGLDDDLERTLVDTPEQLERAFSLLSESSVAAHRVRRELDALSPEAIAVMGLVARGQVRSWLDKWTETLRYIELDIDGSDLIDAGYAPGPEIGRVLESTLDARLDGVIDGTQELQFADDELRRAKAKRDSQ